MGDVQPDGWKTAGRVERIYHRSGILYWLAESTPQIGRGHVAEVCIQWPVDAVMRWWWAANGISRKGRGLSDVMNLPG